MLKDNNTYVQTHYRISVPEYDNGFNWSAETKQQFNEEIQSILTQFGFSFTEPRNSGSCYEGKKGIESLYCHPQDISGYINKKSIQEIEEALKQANTFKFRFTDTYREILNYTNEEFIQELETWKETIIQNLLEVFKTKRSNLYKPEYAKDNVHTDIKFFKSSIVGAAPLEKIEREYINTLFAELVAEGKLVKAQTRSGDSYRTTTDKDLKAKKQTA